MGPTFAMGPPGAIEPPGAMEANQAPAKPPRKYQMFEMSPTSDELRVSNVPAPSLHLLNCSSTKPADWMEEEDKARQGQIDKLAEELRQTSLKNVNSRKPVSTSSKTRLDELKEGSPAKASPGPPARQRSRQPSGVAGKWKITSITVEESKANQVEENFQQISSSQSSSMQMVDQQVQQQSFCQQQQQAVHQQQFVQQQVHQKQQHEQQNHHQQQQQQHYQQEQVEKQRQYQQQQQQQQLEQQHFQQQQIEEQQRQLQQQQFQQQRLVQQQAFHHQQQQIQYQQQQSQVCQQLQQHQQGSRRSSLLPCLPTPWGQQQGGDEQQTRQSSLIQQLSSQYGVERSSSSECNRSSRRSSLAAEPLQTPWGAFPAPAPRESLAHPQPLPAPWHTQDSRPQEEIDQNPMAYLANCPKPNPVYPSAQHQQQRSSRRSSISGVANANCTGTARHSRSSSIDPFGRPIFSFLREDQQGCEHRSRGLESRRSSVAGPPSGMQDVLHSQDLSELKVRNAPVLLAQPKNVSDPGQSQLSRDGSLYQSTEALNSGGFGQSMQGGGRARHRSGSQAPRERRRSGSQGPTYNWLEHGGLVGTGLRVGSEVREPEPKDGLALSRDGGFFMPFGNSENATKKCKTKRQLKAEEEARQRQEEEENRRSLEERAARKEQRKEKRARNRTQSVSSAHQQPLGGGHNNDCNIERCTTNCKVAMTKLGHNYDCIEERCSRNCRVNLRRKGHKGECSEDVCSEDCPVHLRRLGHN